MLWVVVLNLIIYREYSNAFDAALEGILWTFSSAEANRMWGYTKSLPWFQLVAEGSLIR